jgi:HTH-type transcriptional regulator/antitoxin HigA
MSNYGARLDQVDDGFVSPTADSTNFLQVLAALSSDVPQTKWTEIKARSLTKDKLQILIETALEVSASPLQQRLFRKHKDANETLIAIWQAKVLQNAKRRILTEEPSFPVQPTLEDLRNIAKLSADSASPKFIGEVLFKSFGIILVIERAFTGMKLDGLVTKLGTGHPVIGLSLRYPRYNNFWFTLIHELAHVYLHADMLDTVIYDDLDEQDYGDVEVEANRLAADSIIPRHLFNKSAAIRSVSNENVYQLSAQAGVHPALVAGALQHRANNFKIYTDITNSLDVRQILGMQK